MSDHEPNGEGPQVRPREAIEGDLQRLQSQHSRLEDKHKTILESLPESEQEAYHEIAAAIWTISPEHTYNDVNVIERITSQVIAHSQREEEIRQLLDLDVQMSAINETPLKEELLPYIVKDIKEIINNTINRIDYKAVFELIHNSIQGTGSDSLVRNLINDLSRIKRAHNSMLNNNLGNESYFFLESSRTVLADIMSDWNKKGLLNKELAAPQSNEKMHPVDVSQAKDQAKELLDELTIQLSISQKYDITYLRGNKSSSSASEILLLQYLLEDYSQFKSSISNNIDTDIDINFYKELIIRTKKIHQVLVQQGRLPQSLSDTTEYFDHVHTLFDPNTYRQIQIKGLENDNPDHLIVTIDEISGLLREQIPPIFLINIDEIAFVSDNTIKLTELDEIIFAQYISHTGDHGFVTNIEIPIYYTKYKDEYKSQLSPDAPSFTGLPPNEVNKYYLGEIVHEVGHRVQSALNNYDLEIWEKVVSKDDINVTTYVRTSKDVS